MVRGAGVAGITAAQALSNQSVHDFLIVEYNDYIGGRAAHSDFGQKYNIINTYSDYSSITTYDETESTDYTSLLDEYEDFYTIIEQVSSIILSDNLQDTSTRAGLGKAGWKPQQDHHMQAIEWWAWDWEYAHSPEETLLEFCIVNYNTSFYQFSDKNNFFHDSRGFNAFIIGEASTFLSANDPRLLLNAIVTNIEYNDNDVTIWNEDGSCISADYAICTSSLVQIYSSSLQYIPRTSTNNLGVLQNDVIIFTSPLPHWKIHPPGMKLERHQNLRSPVPAGDRNLSKRLWFAGEATSAECFGFLQGAWFEEREAG
ncbi:MAG: hypothetical protein M1834_003252 [Cirrosporium novae-zelandiae]|nr:MAG: hypothetical protein M1834_003252 [Cirrosporium novae-zelandiae]